MARKFKAKKKSKGITFIVILILTYLIYQMGIFLYTSFKLTNSNEEFIINLLNDSNYIKKYEKRENNIFYKLYQLITNITLDKPITILEKGFNYKKIGNIEDVYSEADIKIEDMEKISNYINNPSKVDINNPRVYIYNSHQLEEYSNNFLEGYGITPNVLMASYLLKEKLNKQLISTVVEESNITEFLKINGWDFDYSYRASRFYVLDSLNKYTNLDLIIDLHRDALTKELSTVEIKGKKYAKVLFVVGLEHTNYQKNLDLANKLNDMIKSKYSTLTRGVMTKKGANVNGVYNQDLSPKMILLEVGGQNNSIDEVLNTMDVMTEIIKEYLT